MYRFIFILLLNIATPLISMEFQPLQRPMPFNSTISTHTEKNNVLHNDLLARYSSIKNIYTRLRVYLPLTITAFCIRFLWNNINNL